MKHHLFAAAAAAAFVAVAGQASAQEVVGHVGGAYSWNNTEISGLGDADTNIWEAEAVVAFPVGQLGAQVDGAVTYVDSDDLGIDETGVSLTGHLNFRPGGHIVGAFAGVDHADDATLWAAGVEAQASMENVTFYAQLGYGQSDDLGDLEAWALRGEVRYFVTDTFRLGLNGGLFDAEILGVEVDGVTLGLDAEYQFPATNWSVLAGYQRVELDDLDAESDTFRVGARYTFGGTLKDRDAAGASLGSVGNLFGGAF